MKDLQKCIKCSGDLFELELKETDFNLEEKTMYMRVLMECEDCGRKEHYEVHGNITAFV